MVLRFCIASISQRSFRQNKDGNNTGTSFKIRSDEIFNLSKVILVTDRRTSRLPHFLDNQLTDDGVVLSLPLLYNFYTAFFLN
jgi:hypothetical protein